MNQRNDTITVSTTASLISQPIVTSAHISFGESSTHLNLTFLIQMLAFDNAGWQKLIMTIFCGTYFGYSYHLNVYLSYVGYVLVEY